MKKLNIILRAILGAWMISLLFNSTSSLTMHSTAEAATNNPQITVKKKTLYTGYKNHTIEFKNLNSKAEVSYKSSNLKVVSVSAKGLVKPIAKGTATITVTMKQNSKTFTNKLAITVKDPYINIVNPTDQIDLTTTYRLKTKTYGSNDTNLQWSTSDSSIASIMRGSGTVTPKKPGTVTFTVSNKSSQLSTSITVKITGTMPAPSPTPTPKPTVVPTPTPTPTEDYIYTTVFETDFEQGTGDFTSRGGEQVNITREESKSGSYGLLANGRSASWQGPVKNMTGLLKPGQSYQLSVWVKYKGPEKSLKVQATLDKNQGSQYLPVGSVILSADRWEKLEATIFLPKDTRDVRLYFEITQSPTADIYLDDIRISEISVNEGKYATLPSLHEVYEDYFDIGAAVSSSVLHADITNVLIKDQFNTITYGNEMKPDALLDYETSSSNLSRYGTSPAIKTDRLKELLQHAKDNGFKVRFHTLVWHSQTPRWFFTENYSKDPNAALASKEVMLKRLENYIQKVMSCTKQYPGVIYAWDVVNEAIEPNHRQSNGYRTTDSLWYQIIGEEFVKKAFEYARKYSYDDAGLFYNDYNEYMLPRTTAIYNLASKLKAKGLIDGIGMQSHIDMNFPTLESYEIALRKFGELGLEINVTELDMHNNRNTEAAFEQQANRYAALFEMMIRLNEEGLTKITNITFWGVLDSTSWLTNHRRETSYPLLFDGKGNPKPAYYKLIELGKMVE